MTSCINTVLVDLPETIKGYTRPHGEGYTIIINAKLCDEAQRKAYEHELKHILSGHYNRTDTVAIELEMAREGT
jgi:hypothetical protein